MADLTAAQLEEATEGKYEILSLIGEGGMGAVFLARHRELNSRVAIKVLPPAVRLNADRVARFRREGAVSAQLAHPNLVPVFELDVRGDIAYLVMPYIEGTALDRYLAEHGPMALPDVLKFLSDAGSALAFAHARGVVHRDIKPANILLDGANARWLVTDFGVAHVASIAGEADSLTHTQAVIGTLGYMAPEQLGSAREVDARSDLFSLAMVVYECLTGVIPERDGAAAAADNLHRRRSDIDQRLARALTAPLALARTDRPRAFDDWQRQIQRPSPSRWRPWALAAAGVAVLTGGWWWWSAASARTDPIPTVAVMPFEIDGDAVGDFLSPDLARAFTQQLQMLPDHRALGESSARSAVTRRFGRGPYERDTLLVAASDIGATQAVVGRAVVTADSFDLLRIEVYDVATRRLVDAAEASGPADSLPAMVGRLVVEGFGTRLASERSGTPYSSVPAGGLPAFTAYWEGDRAFRRAAYDRAVGEFDRVIQLDSAFAPAHFKRMLALLFSVQPTRSTAELRSALDAAGRFRDGLDAASVRMLAGYEALLREGDLERAARTFQALTDEFPDAVEAWFVLGLFRLAFPSVTDAPIAAAKAAFQEAVRRDPGFAAALAQLATIAVLEDNRDAYRDLMRRYLAVDSTSVWAELIAMGDTLFFRPANAPRIITTLDTRPREIQENLALAAMLIRPPPGGRPIATSALDVLWSNAATATELQVYFRMRLVAHVGSGELDRARALLRAAATRGVPQREIDTWIVLGAVTPIAALAPDDSARAAAQRLVPEPAFASVSWWLRERYARVDRSSILPRNPDDLRASLEAQGELPPLARSLLQDLEALDRLQAADTTGALTLWEQATARMSIEDAIFGPVSSLWPLRLERAAVAARAERWSVVEDAAGTFTLRTGFADQIAWHPALDLLIAAARARGDSAAAAAGLELRYRVLSQFESTAARDSIANRLAGLRGTRPGRP